jgi:hypothetical protein
MRALSSNAETFHVVILYDHFSAARLAVKAYSHLARELENEFVLKLRIWRVDVAILTDCAENADDDIAAADMVILAVRDTGACFAACQRWTGKTGNRVGMPKQALVAIVEADQKNPVATENWSDVLRSTIEKAQPDAFLWRPPARSGGLPMAV